MWMSRLGFNRLFLVSGLGIVIFSLLAAGCSDFQLSTQGVPPTPDGIVCWGDSMTSGNEGITDRGAYPAILHAKVGVKVVNGGIGGQTSTQIGVRQGGVPAYVTVVGGSIPASGPVTIIFRTGFEPMTSPNGRVRGSILGVKGDVRLSGFLPGGTFTFTPISGSAAVSAPGTPQFIPETPFANYTPIFWEGRNNIFKTAGGGPWGAQQILSDIANQVASVPKGKNYLVLSVLNENGPPERSGQAKYSAVIDLNKSLCSTYGPNYLDIRSILIASYDPSLPTDVSDFDNVIPP